MIKVIESNRALSKCMYSNNRKPGITGERWYLIIKTSSCSYFGSYMQFHMQDTRDILVLWRLQDNSSHWVNMTTEVRQFVLDCPVCQVEKGSHLKPSGKLMPLDLPQQKWDHVAIDFTVGMPLQRGCDTILTVVDKATKMCHFIACSEKISAKEVAKLFWHHVGRLHGIPSVVISDRDVRFTSRFWRELWRVLGTDLRMGSGFHPESSRSG